MYYIFSIHSSLVGHLGRLSILALVNNAAMDTTVCVVVAI